MKKLLVFLCALVIGASVVQAASVDWQVTDAAHKGENIYIYNADLSSAITAWQDGATISEDDTSDVTSALAGYLDTKEMTVRGNSGTISADPISGTITAVIFSDVEDGATFYWTTISTSGLTYSGTDPSPGKAKATSLTTGTFSFASSTPPTPPIPEPTTVALLALGLAALGLKRKVA